jgi:hypothetical protein
MSSTAPILSKQKPTGIDALPRYGEWFELTAAEVDEFKSVCEM